MNKVAWLLSLVTYNFINCHLNFHLHFPTQLYYVQANDIIIWWIANAETLKILYHNDIV